MTKKVKRAYDTSRWVKRTEEEVANSKLRRAEYKKKWQQKRGLATPEKRLIYAATRRAKNRGLEFNLEESDIQIPTHCPYLGIELVPHAPRGTSRVKCISLDRVDNSKGYIKGNVEVISHLANTMKNSATPEQLISFAEELLRRLKSS